MVTQKSEIQYADYRDWSPQDYLTKYYVEVHPSELLTIEFLVESVQKMPPTSVMLDFGCGPTVSHTFPMVPKVQEIHLADYASVNRAFVEKWLANQDDKHNFRAFTSATLRLEGNPNHTEAEVKAREQQARECITRVLPCNVTEADPLGSSMREFYPLVASHYCVEVVSTSKEQWRVYMQNMMSLVKPGGVLLLSAVGKTATNFYRVGDGYFPCTSIDGQDVFVSLCENNFTNIDLRIRACPFHLKEKKYNYEIFAYAVKAGEI